MCPFPYWEHKRPEQALLPQLLLSDQAPSSPTAPKYRFQRHLVDFIRLRKHLPCLIPHPLIKPGSSFICYRKFLLTIPFLWLHKDGEQLSSPYLLLSSLEQTVFPCLRLGTAVMIPVTQVVWLGLQNKEGTREELSCSACGA